ncbi:MAG: cation:dicarboxylate symporter family transporter [Rubripirellula sp.]
MPPDSQSTDGIVDAHVRAAAEGAIGGGATVTGDPATGDPATGDPVSGDPGLGRDNGNPKPKRRLGMWIAIGLILGVLCGVFFGEYCGSLQVIGNAYVGLLQMTVLPYLVLSLISKIGRLNANEARRLGLTALVVLFAFWGIAILLIVVVSITLPPIEGATFFSPDHERASVIAQDFLSTFIPANVFHSLSREYVPAVVVFCLFFGSALMMTPKKEPLLDFLDLCSAGISRVNLFLVRMAPIGLFTLTAAAAGTMHIEELSRLQAYLFMFTIACVIATFGAMPLLLTGLTHIRYRDLLRAAQEPMLTAIATGKLFVVLPQISERCEELLRGDGPPPSGIDDSTASVLVPLAYPFPHVGKILAFIFISFAAWYVGRGLTPVQTAEMAATGAVSSFASPLVSMPYMLDRYQLPQDLMALFILPGFITTRLADVVGVMHLMALTVIVTQSLQGQLRIRWMRLFGSSVLLVVCLVIVCAASRWYLASTKVEYNLDERFLTLEIIDRHDDVVVYEVGDELPEREPYEGSTLDRLREQKLLRVGYHPDHLPYSFFNRKNQLVGFDVELMHRLAKRLDIRLEFIPYEYETVIDQIDSDEIDIAVSGLVINPERLLRVGFTQPYQNATVSVVVPDHRRDELDVRVGDKFAPSIRRLGALQEDIAENSRRAFPEVEVVVVDSVRSFFDGEREDLDGMIMSAEEGAAWNVLYPDHAVVLSSPLIQRPLGLAVHRDDSDWVRFLDRWIDFEKMDDTLGRLQTYWVEGGGTKEKEPRWCVIRNVLHWVP